MTSKVRLNVPPRVIESARAVQHANREALSARQAAGRIRSRAEQQQAAERRAQGLRAPTASATAQQRQIDGGQLEFTRRKGQRIWTRRRVVIPGLHLSISIIDEDSEYGAFERDVHWAEWSAETTFQFLDMNNREQRIEVEEDGKAFFVLIPLPALFDGVVGFPGGFDRLGRAIPVRRPGEGGARSDYYQLIGERLPELARSTWEDVRSVFVYVDNSGSMTTSTVRPDLEEFEGKLVDLEVPYRIYPAATERWILPHLNRFA